MINTFKALTADWQTPEDWVERLEFRFREIGLSPNDPLVLLHLEERFINRETWQRHLSEVLDAAMLRILRAEFHYNSKIWEIDQQHLTLVLKDEFAVESITYIDNWKATDPYAEARAYTFAHELVPPVYARHFELQTLDQFSHILQRYCLNLKEDLH